MLLLISAILGLVYAGGMLALFGAVWLAPEGFEDDRGFHLGARSEEARR